MTLRPLTDHFDLRSALARRAPWDVPREEMADEVAAELARRRTAYPVDVQRERMTREDADRHLAAWSAIADDHTRHAARIHHLSSARTTTIVDQLPPYRLDWSTRVREVRRELALRRNAYPRRIASPTHPLDAATAAKRLDALDAVHWRYWMELWCFAPAETDPARDMARHRHVAERMAAHLASDWECDMDQYGHHVAHRASISWRDIARLADHVAVGGLVASATDHAARVRLRNVARDAYWAALDASNAPSERQSEVAQVGPLFAWLDHLVDHLAPRATIPVNRKAAA